MGMLGAGRRRGQAIIKKFILEYKGLEEGFRIYLGNDKQVITLFLFVSILIFCYTWKFL